MQKINNKVIDLVAALKLLYSRYLGTVKVVN